MNGRFPGRVALALSAGCAGLFLLLALPRLQEPALNHNELVQIVDGLAFADPSLAERFPVSSGQIWFRAWLPWMTLPYLGAPKVYLYAAAFRIFGTRWELVRAVSVVLGTLALVWTVLFAYGLFGAWPAAGLGLWMATDPAFLLFARYDYGPCMCTMVLKMAGLFFLWRGTLQDSRPQVFLGAFLSGLCLWDKMHYLWWIAGLGLACALCITREALARRRLAPILAGGFVLGAAPTLLFNIIHPLRSFFCFDTLREGDITSWIHFIGAGFWARCYLLWETFTGARTYQIVSGANPPSGWLTKAVLFAWLAACAAALAWNRRQGGRSSLRPFAFWVTASSGLLALVFATPLRVMEQHVFLLYPLPHLAIAALAADSIAGRPRVMHGVWLCLLVASVGLHLQTWKAFHRDAARTGGSRPWGYMGLKQIAQLSLERRWPTLITTNCMDWEPLLLYTEGRVRIETSLNRSFRGPQGAGSVFPSESVVVAHAREQIECPGDAEAARFVARAAARPGSPLVSVARIPYSDGSPWAEVYSVR